MASRREQVGQIVRGWLVPMVRSLPHRIASRLRESDEQERLEVVRQLRAKKDRPGLLARKSMGFRTLKDVKREDLEKIPLDDD